MLTILITKSMDLLAAVPCGSTGIACDPPRTGIDINNPTGISAPGPNPGQQGLTILITTFVNTALVIAGIVFLFMLIIGGLRWATSSGDKAALESARGRIINALIGLIIVVASFVISQIVFRMLGIEGVTIQ